MTNASLASLFHPQSVAIIGVSRDPDAVGSAIYQNCKEDGFTGSLYPVNPYIDFYDGIPCFKSVLSIDHQIDIAVVVVPSAIVPSVLEEVGKKAIPFAIIISSGFGETGEKGLELEQKITRIANRYRIRILGPNCLGMIHPNDCINLSFARTKPKTGTIAFLSQSGALGTAILDIITPKSIGFSHFFSLGNKIDLTEVDLLEYLCSDEKTKVIGMYVEQLTDAKRIVAFGKTILTSKNPKPIVVLKGGMTKKGTTAVQSHTGSLAGAPEYYHALFKQAQMIETHSTQEFINALLSFSQNPIPFGPNAAIVTNAGGPAILATDELIQHRVLMPDVNGSHNPIDLLGDASASDFSKTLDILEKNESIHSILGIVTPQKMTNVQDLANAFCIHKKKSAKPLAVCFMGDDVMKEGQTILSMGNIPHSKYPEQTARMISCLHDFLLRKQHITEKQTYPVFKRMTQASPVDTDNYLKTIQSVGIQTPNFLIADASLASLNNLSALSEKIVIKALSPQIIHKSDYGAVELNVPKSQAFDVAKRMINTIQNKNPTIHIDRVLFMDMVNVSHGLECIVGLKRESGLGTLIMVGIGGIYVEVMNDVSFRFAPLTPFDAYEMLSELKAKPLFEGARGKEPLDVDALVQVLMTVSDLSQQNPEIDELDINPLLVNPKGSGTMALDCRMHIRGKKE